MIRLFLVAGLGLYTVFATGCSGAGDPPPPMDVEATNAPKTAPSSVEVCQNHEEGCPCDVPGETTDCGRIKRVEGDYVWCSTGHQVCTDDGEWGKCKGDVDTTQASTAQ
jgi:hypothetical protein